MSNLDAAVPVEISRSWLFVAATQQGDIARVSATAPADQIIVDLE
ncbi:hypothetical protein [Rhodococcus koreensis]